MFNKLNGLQILINDTEYTEIVLEVIIHDHFGLDKKVALNYQYYPAGFASWLVLQHLSTHRPFEKFIKVRQQIEWYP